MEIKAVVFDMDGVILDTERLSHDAWLHFAKEEGIDNLAVLEELYCEAMGKSEDEIAESFHNRLGYDDYPALYRNVLQWHEEHSPGGVVPMREGAREVLEFLHEQQIPIGLASATTKDIVTRELQDNGVLSYFSAVLAGDMVSHCKPDPELYLRACEELGVRPEDAYGVEDGYNGVLAIRAAGMRAILAEDQYHPTEEIAAMCEVVLPSMFAVRDYLQQQLQ